MNEKFPLALPVGSVLAGQYVIEAVLGQGGFGITYRALDHKTNKKVAIKEFFPDSMATRTQTTVVPFTGERGESYEYGKECFLEEAKTLAEFIGNENIVRIHSYFEENGTAYFVMDYVEGVSFDDYIKRNGGRLTFEDTTKILIPVMDALYVVHSKGIIHRDVTPDNIFITSDGVVKLLDFGAARYSLGDKSCSLDVVLKHGFAPKEQYTRRGKQGPYTDVYALGATYYFALTGKRPPDSIERMDEDDLIAPSTLGVSLPPAAESAILTALSVQPSERFQNMKAFKNSMLSVIEKENVHQETPKATVTENRIDFSAAKQESSEISKQTVNASAPVANTDYAQQAVKQAKSLGDQIKNALKTALIIFGILFIGLILLMISASKSGKSKSSQTPTPQDTQQASTPLDTQKTGATADSEAADSSQQDKTKETPKADESAQVKPEDGNAQSQQSEESTGNLYPEITGNTVNNLLIDSDFTSDGIIYSKVFESTNIPYHCLSSIGSDYYYGLDSSGQNTVPCLFHCDYEKKDIVASDVPQLSKINGIERLLVAANDNLFFAFCKDKNLYSVKMDSGEITGEKSLGDSPFTFSKGYLYYVKSDGSEWGIYRVAAGNISADGKKYIPLYDVSNVHYIICGSDGTLYVSGTSTNGNACINIFDLSNMSETYNSEFSDTIKNVTACNCYGSYLYCYVIKDDDSRCVYRFKIESGLTQEQELYVLSADETVFLGMSISEDGKELYFTAYPDLIRMNSDGSGEPEILTDYYR